MTTTAAAAAAAHRSSGVAADDGTRSGEAGRHHRPTEELLLPWLIGATALCYTPAGSAFQPGSKFST